MVVLTSHPGVEILTPCTEHNLKPELPESDAAYWLARTLLKFEHRITNSHAHSMCNSNNIQTTCPVKIKIYSPPNVKPENLCLERISPRPSRLLYPFNIRHWHIKLHKPILNRSMEFYQPRNYHLTLSILQVAPNIGKCISSLQRRRHPRHGIPVVGTWTLHLHIGLLDDRGTNSLYDVIIQV